MLTENKTVKVLKDIDDVIGKSITILKFSAVSMVFSMLASIVIGVVFGEHDPSSFMKGFFCANMMVLIKNLRRIKWI
jgi:hypothetical protein